MLTSLTKKPINELLTKAWKFTQKIPKGNYLFSKFAGFYIPYTGSISPIVLEMKPGLARVMLRDRRKVRNHLDSVHALAVANVGEFATGLSLVSQLGLRSKTILVNLSIEYLKKARGTLIAEARGEFSFNSTQDTDCPITAYVRNSEGDVVAVVKAVWRVRSSR